MIQNLELALFIAAVLQAGDVLTTTRFLKHGKGEKNPLIKAFMRLAGGLWWVPKLGLAAVAYGALAWVQWLPGIWLLNAFYFGVCVWNWRLVR